MTACPAPNLLLGLLEESLADDELAEIVVHVQICVPCQEELEALTNGDAWKSTLQEAGDALQVNCSHSAGLSAIAANETVDIDAGSGCLVEPPEVFGGSTAPETCDHDPAELDGRHHGEGARRNAARRPSAGSRRFPSIPGYEILAPLGEGGMGVVYKARQVKLNRLVALKMIRGGSEIRPDHLARFALEAMAVARLKHPNILQIHDTGEIDGLPYVTLELLEGGSLAERLDGTPRPARPSSELLVTLAEAIVAAHEAGIIHRDLKPSNVLFAQDGTPKITDFGLAKRIESDDHHTESGQVMGSPSYMAPEQARGHTRNIGPLADVYALGAVLYELITGRPPFKGETPIETIRQVIDEDPVPPSRLVPRVARDLETISLKCLQKDPHKRYHSAQAIADDLTRFLKGEPIKARPIGPWERGVKWTRRRPLFASALGVASVVVIGLGVGLLVWDRHVRDQERKQLALDAQKRQGGTKTYVEAQRALANGDLESMQVARTRLESLEQQIKDDKNLADLATLVHAERERGEARILAVKSAQSDADRFEDFIAKRDDAFLFDTSFTCLDSSSSHAETARAARAALSVFGSWDPTGAWRLSALPANLGPQHDEIKQGCFELLLVLADSLEKPQESLNTLEQCGQLRGPTRAYHLRRATALLRAGDEEGARREHESAEKLPPSTASDHFLLGWDLYKKEDWKMAAVEYEKALRIQSTHSTAKTLAALCAFHQRDAAVAREKFNSCLERGSKYPWLYIWRAMACGEQFRAARSGRDGTRRPEDLAIFEAALDDYNKALALLANRPDKVTHWALLVNRGELYWQRGDFDRSSADLTAAIQLDDRRPQAFVNLAAVRLQQHKPDGAFELYSRAIALEPRWPKLYRARADLNITRAKDSSAYRLAALKDLDLAIRLESRQNLDLARDHTKRARLFLDDGRNADALKGSEAAIKIWPDDPEANEMRLRALLELKKYDDVLRSCDALLRRVKSSASVYALRALARTGLKDFPGALSDYTQALALEGSSAPLLAQRGAIYLIVDAPRLARPDFEEAIRLDSSSADALLGRGAARVRLGEHHEAVADAQQALAMGIPKAERLYQAARIFARAAVAARADVRKRGKDALFVAEKYQDQGTALLRETLAKLPGGERDAFWREVVQADPDPAMNALRRRLRSDGLVTTHSDSK